MGDSIKTKRLQNCSAADSLADQKTACGKVRELEATARTAPHAPTSALLSAFLSRFSRNVADFFGHRACPFVLPSFFACRRKHEQQMSGAGMHGTQL